MEDEYFTNVDHHFVFRSASIVNSLCGFDMKWSSVKMGHEIKHSHS